MLAEYSIFPRFEKVVPLSDMKFPILISLLLIYVQALIGQTSSPSPEKTKLDFGHSLEKYDTTKKKKTIDVPKPATIAGSEKEEVLRVETDLVVHDVMVTDQAGNLVSGLTKGDFAVSEDGVAQGIEVFSSGGKQTVPRSIVLIIDSSLTQTHLLKTSIAGAKAFVDKLEPEDKMAIVTIDMVLRQDYTTDKGLLKKALDHVELMGWELAIWYGRGAKREDIKNYKTLEDNDKSAIRGGPYETLIAVLNEKFNEPGRQRMLIFQGDGKGVIWLKPDKDLPYPVSHLTRMNSGMKYVGESKSMSKIGFTDVKETIETSRATIYSIITGMRLFGFPEKERLERIRLIRDEMNKVHGWLTTGSSEERRIFEGRDEKVLTAGQAAMFRVAELAGGNTAVMEKAEDATRIYSDIFGVIKNRYVLGYYPTNAAKSETRRIVKVSIRGHPEYLVTARQAYIRK